MDNCCGIVVDKLKAPELQGRTPLLALRHQWFYNKRTAEDIMSKTSLPLGAVQILLELCGREEIRFTGLDGHREDGADDGRYKVRLEQVLYIITYLMRIEYLTQFNERHQKQLTRERDDHTTRLINIETDTDDIRTCGNECEYQNTEVTAWSPDQFSTVIISAVHHLELTDKH